MAERDVRNHEKDTASWLILSPSLLFLLLFTVSAGAFGV